LISKTGVKFYCINENENNPRPLFLHSEPLVISAEAGEVVNLTCTFVDKEVMMWYKQRLEHAPLEVGLQLEGKSAVISDQFDRSRFKLNRTASGISLSIERVTKEDEGMYFCGLNTSVLQTAVRWSVSPGESVTLQCTVMSEIRAADLRVLWFRAAAGQSFPEIIYTHQNSSSRQCEISSSTSCSLYEFSKNILDQHHTGTYYCAVAVCGKIIFGNGTSVELSKCSCVLLGTCSIFVLFIFKSMICINIKRENRKCDRNRFCNLCCKTTHHTLFIQYRH
uniref:Ig-like domain-containing protein n=1 Tax=Pygocentrus nattereri TaxID=42514 RepID=A0A3B4CZY5_PYGNA